MPLTATDQPPEYDFESQWMRFVMADGAKAVECILYLAALDALQAFPSSWEEAPALAKFAAHRQQIQAVASAKYDSIFDKQDVTSLTLTAADVVPSKPTA